MVNLHKGHKRKDGKDVGKLIHNMKEHDHVSVMRSIMMYSLTSLVTLIIAFAIFNYMETGVPEGVPEVWNARILDTSLRTMGKVILTLNNFGVHGGVTWWTRKMVEVMLTTLITGSPRGLGDDPELKIYDTKLAGVDVKYMNQLRERTLIVQLLFTTMVGGGRGFL